MYSIISNKQVNKSNLSLKTGIIGGDKYYTIIFAYNIYISFIKH